MTRSSWGLDTDRDLDWRQFAACGPKNAEWFFVVGGKLSALNRLALELCAGCPVTSECLADARSFRVDASPAVRSCRTGFGSRHPRWLGC